MANGKIQIKDGAGNNLFPKVRTIDMTDSAGNVKLFDGEKIRPQFIPNAVDDIVPYAAVTSNAGVATVSQQADYHYINVTSKKIYATVHNGTSFVWDGGSALNTTTLYTSNGKSFRWDGTNLVEIVLPKAMASAINTNTNTNEFVPTVAATTAYFQPKGNYAAAGHNHNGTYVSKLVAGANITLSPATGTGGEITISATDTNTWAVSSVKGANGLTQNASTGNVIISGIDTKGDSSTKGVVITTSVITSNAGGNTSVVPTMNAIYTALAGKAATNHTHNYAASDHITVVSKGNNNVTVGSAVNGSTTTYYVSTTDTNTWAVSAVSATNGVGMSNAVKTGTPVVSGIDCTGDGTTVGVIITSNGITSTTSNATNGPQSLKETKNIVPTMRAVYNALAGKADTGHTHNYAAATHSHTIANISGLQTALDGKAATGHTHNYTSVVLASGNGTTAGIVVTKSAIESNTTSANTYEVPTMLAVYNALAAKAAANHNHDTVYAAKNHSHDYGVTKLIAGANITLNPATGVGQVTITATDTNTWAVSSVTGYNGLIANPTTGVVKVSGVNTKGDGTTIGVVVTSNGIVSTVATNAATSATNLAETSYIVPTMRAVYNALAGKANATHTHAYANTSHQHAISDVTGLQTALDGKQATIAANTYAAYNHTHNYAAATHSHTIAQISNLQTTLDGKAAVAHSHTNYISRNAGIAVNAYYFSGLNNCPAMRSRYENASWFDSNTSSTGLYPGWLAPITADGMTEVLNTFSLGRGYTISGAGGSSSYSIANFGSFLSGCAVPTFMTFATTVSDLSAAVSGKADIGHTHNYATSNTSYTAAQLSTNHTHNYAAATHTHNYAPTSHQHAISDVTNLQTALDGKQTSGNYATSLQLTNVANKLDGVSSSVANANIGNCGIEDVILHTESAKYVRADHIKGDLFVQQFYKTSVCATSANVSTTAQNNATVFISCTGSPALNGFYYTGKKVSAKNSAIWACMADGKLYRFDSAHGTLSEVYADTYAVSNHTHTGYATSNTSYTAANLSTNHSHAIAKVVGLQTALDSKADTGHTHSGYIRNQAAYAVDGYFFSGLSECSAMRSKYESTLWTHSGGSGTYPGWVAPITATGVTEITNLFNYCKGYASNASVNINVQSFFSACAVPTFMGFAHAIVELNNSLEGKQATIPANTYAPYTHTHTGYATSNTSYTAAQLSTNHSHVLANGNYGSGAVKTYSGITSVATSGNTCVVPTMNAVWSRFQDEGPINIDKVVDTTFAKRVSYGGSGNRVFFHFTDTSASNGIYYFTADSVCASEYHDKWKQQLIFNKDNLGVYYTKYPSVYDNSNVVYDYRAERIAGSCFVLKCIFSGLSPANSLVSSGCWYFDATNKKFQYCTDTSMNPNGTVAAGYKGVSLPFALAFNMQDLTLYCWNGTDLVDATPQFEISAGVTASTAIAAALSNGGKTVINVQAAATAFVSFKSTRQL